MDSGQKLNKNYFLKPKSLYQHIYDFFGIPLRLALLSDLTCRRLGLTSLQDERIRAVMPKIEGKLLDIGAGNNLLVKLYGNGIGVDVYDFGGNAMIVEDTRELPFENSSFETITFVACLNHIPYREQVMREAYRLLKPGGKVIATMISPLLGKIGHVIWWYSEEKKRGIKPGEKPGLSDVEMRRLLEDAGFVDAREQSFVYGLNHLYQARKSNHPEQMI